MSEEWRIILYPLGLIASVAFTTRFLIQWLFSEYKRQSLVPISFWAVSLVGNGLLLLHSIFQAQMPITIMQALNGSISWRNLNLQQQNVRRFSLIETLLIFAAVLGVSVGLFFWLNWDLPSWFRVPFPDYTLGRSFGLELIGYLGIFLYHGRFCFQWVYAEFLGCSTLPPFFWWSSIFGALFSLIYFSATADPVNVLGPLFGMIPYGRNLVLLYKQKSQRSAG